jgi:16S rRNA (uracil1498-N3)-methyltransferase
MKTTPRLHLDAGLDAQRDIALEREQAHYLSGVLRLAAGDPVSVLNARDGEWLA